MSENLGLELKNYREAHSLTQMDVALLLDCSGASVSVWERGAPMLGLSGVAVRTLLSLNDPYKVLQAGAPALEAELTRLRGGERQAGQRTGPVEGWVPKSEGPGGQGPGDDIHPQSLDAGGLA